MPQIILIDVLKLLHICWLDSSNIRILTEIGELQAGDVQWMTASAGVIYSEMPGKEFAKTGGRFHGLQLWVNLPRIKIVNMSFFIVRTL